MKVLFAALVMLVSLTLTKGNAIDIGWQLYCKMSKEMPERMNKIKECDTKVYDEKAAWVLGAVRDCEKKQFPTDNLNEFFNEMCKEERKADVQEMKNCINEKFAEHQEDPESTLTELINSCL
ncbi:uncharacterized protein LOC111088864 [Limulus polyphemus]|uniref:Uncharacterized protein LOC111088864 n=1 Tax=Limulus polyphemus TaxID=6850 RepID=A0ABM1TIM8_LIMPO|nr:uncharacterized protein LOC111088864 [Limulus polyphemus]